MGAHEIMQKLEALRKKVYFYNMFPMIAIVGLMIFLFVRMMNGGLYSGSIIMSTFFPFIIIVVIVAGVNSSGKKVKLEYKQLYKDTFVNTILKSMLEDVSYDWRGGFSEMDVATFGVVKIGNIFKSEDYLSGSYKGVNFRQADVTIKHETGSGDDRQVTTYFDGRMFEFKFDGKSVQNVKVFSSAYKSWLNLRGENVELEDIQFNKSFDVFSLEPLDAFYLLTPQMMERISNLHRRYNNIGFRFGEGRLCVAINGPDAFDGDYRKKLSYPEEYARVKQEVQVIIDIIEMIGLMQKEA